MANDGQPVNPEPAKAVDRGDLLNAIRDAQWKLVDLLKNTMPYASADAPHLHQAALYLQAAKSEVDKFP